MERSLSHSFFSEELRLQMWKASNKLIWGSIFFLIFVSILDFLLIKDLYVTLTMLNLAALALIVLCNYTLTKIQQKPMWLLHMVFIILIFLFLYSLSLTNEIGYHLYLPLIAVTFVTFNSIAIWPIAHSVFEFILLCLLIIGLSYYNIIDFDLLVESGGYTALAIAAVSITFPSIKLLSLKDDITDTYKQKQKIKQLTIQNTDLEKEIETRTTQVKRNENIAKVFRHDLKNKLGSIESLIELIELEDRYILQNGQNDYLKMIKNSLADATGENTFFKHFNEEVTQEQAVLNRSIVDLHELVTTNGYKFFEKTTSQNIQLKTDLKAKNSMIYVDKNIADVAIYNLMKYALDFSKNNDVIAITTRNYEHLIILEIVNRTTGISMTELESYFKNINDYNLKEMQQNKGLGLSISKNHIELLDGHLRYSASNTLGFEFLVEFTFSS